MRTKTLTTDCPSCDFLKIDDRSQFVCHWGKGNKILEPHKGKKPRFCKLRR